MKSRLLLSSSIRARPSVSAVTNFWPVAFAKGRCASGHYQQHPIKTREGLLLSRVSGPTDKPLSELSLPKFWSQLSSQYADRPALISRHEPATQHGLSTKQTLGDDCVRWTFGEMHEHITKLVSGLLDLGVRKGDRVAVLMM